MSSSDFFRNFQSLFESSSTQTNDLDKQSRGLLATKDGDKALAGVKKKVDDEYGSDKNKDPKTNKTEDGEEVYETKQASNVKETAGAFFRRYSDIIKEAEEEQVNEISLKTKINAFAKRSQDDYAAGENGEEGNSSDKIGANILKKHGQTAYDHANKAGNAAVMGRDDASGASKSDTGDSLAKSGPNSRIRKDGKINKQDSSALKTKIKSYGHGRVGPKANLP